ncbi:tRNA (adenine(58)-N(1))-methyltransferase non-catalytic subunit TRM6 [Folsomia candida]|uniref:tRNA (adenine(58)-N(1))-methyltransferase non-catalytic subunit TRM6 n=1 Tax=Folsomia candida TaxID=158441 RepID=UPI000B907534|nr:tRNA (adenine(58)-N(1))-methyltransferase non-catalytic subunit TRM6 [Folsomia candida]
MEEGIKNGEFVVVQRGAYQRVILFQEEQTMIFGKGQSQQEILLKKAAGQPFYSAFRIVALPLDEYPPKVESSSEQKGNKNRGKAGNKPARKLYSLEKATEPASKSFSQLTYEAEAPLPKGKDNRNIIDDKSSQPLGQSDIHNLKDQGLTSQEILTTIISSSKSFVHKTEYSQEKYLRKKEKVHGDLLLFLKPDLAIVTEYFFKKDPMKVLGLRLDTVSQILSYANVHANEKFLVYENGANGLLVAGMLQRMGGLGTLLHCHAGTNPQQQALSYLNLSEVVKQPLRNLDIFYLIKGRGINKSLRESAANGDKFDEEMVASLSSEDHDSPLCKKPKRDSVQDEDIRMETSDDKCPKSDSPLLATTNSSSTKPSSCNRNENEKSLEMLNSTKFHGLVICGREHPLSVFQRLLPHLLPSSPFVIYSGYPEPLMECYTWVKESGFGVNIHIVDNWMRNIQVETDRTHPEITMSSSGGYILYGTYVRNSLN